MWPQPDPHTAHPRETGVLSKDLERFRGFLQGGVPGAHAYVALLGLDTFDAAGLIRSVQKGFGYRTFERLHRNMALPAERLMVLVGIPRRTLTRRKSEGRFLPEESDRLLRASRVFGKALELFEGDREAAMTWLKTRQPALGGVTPLDLARTEVGAGEVERLIHQLEHGVFP